MIERILIDVDDVLADCTGAAMRHMGLHDWMREDHTLGHRDIIEQYEIATNIRYTPAQFWEHFKREWWASIPVTPWCYDLIDMCTKYVDADNIALLTTPVKCGDCLAGKMDWIEEFMPKFLHRQYLISPRKNFCAAPGAILIDDLGPNTKSFSDAGGAGITFPQPWNQCKERMGEELQYVGGWLDYHAE